MSGVTVVGCGQAVGGSGKGVMGWIVRWGGWWVWLSGGCVGCVGGGRVNERTVRWWEDAGVADSGLGGVSGRVLKQVQMSGLGLVGLMDGAGSGSGSE